MRDTSGLYTPDKPSTLLLLGTFHLHAADWMRPFKRVVLNFSNFTAELYSSEEPYRGNIILPLYNLQYSEAVLLWCVVVKEWLSLFYQNYL